ncbi:hypothetical protein L1887_12281 [Cichorium endivia]|nr:hypothetical protein L1887_12281 [Cichorium endivia]
MMKVRVLFGSSLPSKSWFLDLLELSIRFLKFLLSFFELAKFVAIFDKVQLELLCLLLDSELKFGAAAFRGLPVCWVLAYLRAIAVKIWAAAKLAFW